MSFKQNLYQVVKGAITPELCLFIDGELELLRQVHYLNNKAPVEDGNFFADGQVKNSFPYYGAMCTEILGQYLQPKIEEITNRVLYPTYSYMRIYYNGAIMHKHTDRPSCEYSATVCISNKPDPWDIWFKTLDGVDKSFFLEPGDMIVYKGDVLPHWRNEYKGSRQTQVFVHFVDANGQYSDYKFDRRPFLGLPSTTSQDHWVAGR